MVFKQPHTPQLKRESRKPAATTSLDYWLGWGQGELMVYDCAAHYGSKTTRIAQVHITKHILIS